MSRYYNTCDNYTFSTCFFFIFTDIKNVSRKELSSAFQTAIKDLPKGDVKEAIEAQFEKYLGDFER